VELKNNIIQFIRIINNCAKISDMTLMPAAFSSPYMLTSEGVFAEVKQIVF
jgi:hypothetical protein